MQSESGGDSARAGKSIAALRDKPWRPCDMRSAFGFV